MNSPDIKKLIFTTLYLHISLLKILGQSRKPQLIPRAKTQQQILSPSKCQKENPEETSGKWGAGNVQNISGLVTAPSAMEPQKGQTQGTDLVPRHALSTVTAQPTPPPFIPIPLILTGARWWNSPQEVLDSISNSLCTHKLAPANLSGYTPAQTPVRMFQFSSNLMDYYILSWQCSWLIYTNMK